MVAKDQTGRSISEDGAFSRSADCELQASEIVLLVEDHMSASSESKNHLVTHTLSPTSLNVLEGHCEKNLEATNERTSYSHCPKEPTATHDESDNSCDFLFHEDPLELPALPAKRGGALFEPSGFRVELIGDEDDETRFEKLLLAAKTQCIFR